VAYQGRRRVERGPTSGTSLMLLLRLKKYARAKQRMERSLAVRQIPTMETAICQLLYTRQLPRSPARRGI
jgi:hypothetical protein